MPQTIRRPVAKFKGRAVKASDRKKIKEKDTVLANASVELGPHFGQYRVKPMVHRNTKRSIRAAIKRRNKRK